jgi:hypothetical protein
MDFSVPAELAFAQTSSASQGDSLKIHFGKVQSAMVTALSTAYFYIERNAMVF